MEDNSIVWYNLGNLQTKLGDFKAAIESFNHSIRMRPVFNALLNASVLLIQNNEFDTATQYLDMLIQTYPNDSRIYINKGFLMEKKGNTEAALDYFDLSLGVNIHNFLGWYNRGNILCDMKKYKEALNSFKIATQIYPGESHSINNKGYAQFLLGSFHDALLSFELAMKLERNNTIAASNYIKTRDYLANLISKLNLEEGPPSLKNKKRNNYLNRNQSSFSYIEQTLVTPIVN
jgi:tetratricopeptide (TPR) repeat protein